MGVKGLDFMANLTLVISQRLLDELTAIAAANSVLPREQARLFLREAVVAVLVSRAQESLGVIKRTAIQVASNQAETAYTTGLLTLQSDLDATL